MVDSGQGHPVSVGGRVGRGNRRMDYEPAAYGGGNIVGCPALSDTGVNAMEVAYGGMVHDFCWRNRRFTGRR